MSEKPSLSQQAQGSYIAQVTQGGTAIVNVMLPSPAEQEQSRVIFLKKLRSRYNEAWEQAFEGVALMTLGLTSKPDAVQHHTELLLLSPQLPEHALPQGTSIAQVYEQAAQELLILGEPGAGKSTLLLELARQLVGRAEQAAAQPLPVILPLSTWAIKQQPLADWLCEQLAQIYEVPTWFSDACVQKNQILPLLDGLDEVPQEARVACIQAINTYHKEHLVPLGVCSRRLEYEEIPPQERLVLQSAVVVQPLTQEQVEGYLLQGGKALTAVRMVLHTNPVLRELTTTPLMLYILTLTYAGAKASELPRSGTAQEQQQIIFARYTECMIERKKTRISFSLQQMIPWLSWLARQMRQHNLTVFYLEQLQPDWLSERRWRWLSYRIAAQLGNGLLAGLAGGLLNMVLGGLLVGMLFLSISSGSIIIKEVYALTGWGSVQVVSLGVYGLVIWVLLGLVGGLLVGLLHRMEVDIKPAEVLHWSWRGMWRGVRTDAFLKGGLGTWLLFGLVSGLVIWLLVGLVGLVFGGAEGGLLGGAVGLVGGLLVGLLPALLMMIFALEVGFPLCPISGAISECIERLSNSPLEQHIVIRPNQHRQRAGRGSLLIGLASGLVCGPIYVLFAGGAFGFILLIASLRGGIEQGIGLLVGFMAGVIVTLLSGLANGLFIGLTYHIEAPLQPVPVVVRLWKSILMGVVTNQSLRRGVSIGVVTILLMGLFLLLSPPYRQLTKSPLEASLGAFEPITWLIFLLYIGLTIVPLYGWIFGLAGGIVRGLSSTMLEAQTRIRPNQGIRRSACNGMVVGLASWLVLVAFFALLGGLVAGLVTRQTSELAFGLYLGGSIGLISGLGIGPENGLFHGGSAYIQHSVLRFLLWRAGYMPWNYVRFLNEATDCILLRRVGGSYSFIHRLLLDYFADLEPPARTAAATQPPPAVKDP